MFRGGSRLYCETSRRQDLVQDTLERGERETSSEARHEKTWCCASSDQHVQQSYPVAAGGGAACLTTDAGPRWQRGSRHRSMEDIARSEAQDAPPHAGSRRFKRALDALPEEFRLGFVCRRGTSSSSQGNLGTSGVAPSHCDSRLHRGRLLKGACTAARSARHRGARSAVGGPPGNRKPMGNHLATTAKKRV